jgi:hypothetical protein
LALRSRADAAGGVLVAAGAFAAAELAAGLLIGQFFALGRAEAVLFLIFRPWLLLAAAMLVARRPWRERLSFYAAALILAAAAETALLLALGAADPWAEMLRGLAAGLGVAAIADLLVQAGRRRWPPLGLPLAALVFGLLFVTLGGRGYEAVVLGETAPRPAAPQRPPLLLMTGLPLIWGEGGAFDPASRPAAAYRLLEREYDVRPIDAIEPPALAGARLMLLAQPRLLAPEELVTLDGWVRDGGRILILTDPRLSWPSRFPPGDARRPPEAGLLSPLLTHWGLRLDPPTGAGEEQVVERVGDRRLRLESPGLFAATGPACRVAAPAALARCRIGSGEAMLVADADLLRDGLWTVESAARGAERHLRTADNPILVADWLDRLAGQPRTRRDPPVSWLDSAKDRGFALFSGAIPIALALLAGLGLRRFGRH